MAISCHHCLTEGVPHGKIIALRESPSGKASAFQADIRGFESRLPLSDVEGCRSKVESLDFQLATLNFQSSRGPWRSG